MIVCPLNARLDAQCEFGNRPKFHICLEFEPRASLSANRWRNQTHLLAWKAGSQWQGGGGVPELTLVPGVVRRYT
jgi:hypothetical protein